MARYCVICGTALDAANIYVVQDVAICENCYDAEVGLCSYCSSEAFTYQMHDVHGELLCSSCFYEYFAYCNHCEEPTPWDEMEDGYCPECAERLRTRCRACGAVGWHRDFVDGYCDNCRVVRSYGKTLAFEFVGYAPYYGIELEVEFEDWDPNVVARELVRFLEAKNIGRYFDIKSDSSLDNGFELASQPASIRAHKSVFRWAEILEFLREHSGEASERCGLHIHVGKSAVSKSVMGKVLVFMATAEEPILQLSRRQVYGYCVPNHWRAGVSAKEPARAKLDAVEKMMHSGRYCALNFTPESTIELRLFAATLEPVEFYGAIEFYDAMLTFASLHSIAAVSAENAWDKFCRFVRQCPQYPNLQKLIA